MLSVGFAARGVFGGSLFGDAKAFIFGAEPELRQVPAFDFFGLSPQALDGASFPFASLKGRVVLVTNVASE